MWNTFLNFFCKRDLNPVMNGKKLLFWILLRFRLRRVWLFWRREGEWENVVQFSTPCRAFFFAYDQYIFPQSIWLFEMRIYRLFIHEFTTTVEIWDGAWCMKITLKNLILRKRVPNTKQNRRSSLRTFINETNVVVFEQWIKREISKCLQPLKNFCDHQHFEIASIAIAGEFYFRVRVGAFTQHLAPPSAWLRSV